MAEWAPQLGGGRSRGTKHKRLTEAIVADIERGALQVGTGLLPHRDLAYWLGVSTHTVSVSYKEAERRGYLRSEVGRCTLVRSRVTERVDRFIPDRNPRDLVDFSIIRAAYTESHEAAARALLRAMAEEENGAWMRPCRPVDALGRHRATDRYSVACTRVRPQDKETQ